MVGDKFIVPVLTHIYEKGILAADRARSLVEYKIRNEKKAEQIIKKIGNASSLEAVAQATGQQVMRSDSIAFNSPYIPNLGNELKVLGAAFNANNQSKISAPIKGEIGVFLIKVDNISAVANSNFDAASIKQQMEMQMESQSMRMVEALKKSATIKDYREKFY
jgi:peptidyl-prolyl cis-trans isomerase D